MTATTPSIPPRLTADLPVGAPTRGEADTVCVVERSPLPAALRCATPDARLVDVPAFRALAVDGAGLPAGPGAAAGDARFARVCQSLCDAAGALARRSAFHVGPLEIVWWLDGAPAHEESPARWCWRLRVGVPNDVSADDARAAAGDVASPDEIFVEHVAARRMMRALRRAGDDEATVFTAVLRALHERALRPGDHWAEVFLTDPLHPTPNAKAVVLVAVAP